MVESNIIKISNNLKSKIVISYIQEGGKNTVAHCRVYDTIVQ